MPAQPSWPFFYTFLPRMFVSLFLEGRFATMATFDAESFVDSSHLPLLTWLCPWWLFQFTVIWKKLWFYTEKMITIEETNVNLEIQTNKAWFEWIMFPGASYHCWSLAISLSHWNILKLGYCSVTTAKSRFEIFSI